MAENPQNPHNLRNYDDVRRQNAPAAAETGFWASVRERFTRAVTGADQLGDKAAATPAPSQKDGVLRWADTGEPYMPQEQTPNATRLKPYAPQTAAASAADIQNLPVLTIRASQQATRVDTPQAPEAQSYQIRGGDTLGGIAEKQTELRAASGLEGQSSVWAVAIATAKLNGMQTVNDTIRAGDTLQLPSAEMVREMVQALNQSVAADGKITWSEAKSVEAQQVSAGSANPPTVSR